MFLIYILNLKMLILRVILSNVILKLITSFYLQLLFMVIHRDEIFE